MLRKLLIFSLILVSIAKGNTSKELVKEDGRSLVFVFDTTGSMYNDLKQLREGAEMILDAALEGDNDISNFVFVPYHDPLVGPPTVTSDKDVFKSALEVIQVKGGGDCPEKAMGGLSMALNVSLPGSFVYVFTDATAGDHELVGSVLDLVQRKRSQVVFVLTGHCGDVLRPSYQAYGRVAAASSGQVFNLNKTGVHEVLDFVRSSLRGRSVNLGGASGGRGRDFTRALPVDSSLRELTLSVSGPAPRVAVSDPRGRAPRVFTALDMPEIKVLKLHDPMPGNWTISVASDDNYWVSVAGLSNVTFHHGFSVHRPASLAETSHRPLIDAYNYMLLSLTGGRRVSVTSAEVLDLNGTLLFEVPVTRAGDNTYLADAFKPPEDLFYVAINGEDEYGNEVRRVGATAIQPKLPDRPYLRAAARAGRRGARVVLTCRVESLVAVTAVWTRHGLPVGNRVHSVQSTVLEYAIDALAAGDRGEYRCVAENAAGLSAVYTHVELIVDPPHVSVSDNATYSLGDVARIQCKVFSEAKVDVRIVNGATGKDIDINRNSSKDDWYVFEAQFIAEDDTLISCTAVNEAGSTTVTTWIHVRKHPTARIHGSHNITQLLRSRLNLTCSIERGNIVKWLAPNKTVVKEELTQSSVLVTEQLSFHDEGEWTCAAFNGAYEAQDSIQLTLQTPPQVKIQGPKKPLLYHAESYNITCDVIAKPELSTFIWYTGNGTVLPSQLETLPDNTYRSTLSLNNVSEHAAGSYVCYAENDLGFAQKDINVRTRRNMTVSTPLLDSTFDIDSEVKLPCVVDSYPAPTIQWYHNNTLSLNASGHYLTIKQVGLNDSGLYSCVVRNQFEELNLTATLSVVGLEGPQLSKDPVRRFARRGHAAVLACRVLKGKPAPTIKWQFKADSSDIFGEVPDDVEEVASSRELVIARVGLRHAGAYRCWAENCAGSDVYESVLVVQYPPELTSDTTNSSALEVKAGGTLLLSCRADGVPAPLVTWTRDGAPIAFSDKIHLTASNELVLRRASAATSAVYSCAAASELGSARRAFTVRAYDPPRVQSAAQSVSVLEGAAVELPCAAAGLPPPTVLWRRGGTALEDRRMIVDEDFGLRFVANLTDFGEYECVATNKYGSASLTHSVFVWVPPSMSDPLESDRRARAGAAVSLECSAVGYPVPAIRWEHNGDVLANGSRVSVNEYGNLNLPAVTSSQAGVYTCVAENMAGVAAHSVQLFVLYEPKILEENFTGPYMGSDKDTYIKIPCRAKGMPTPFIIWSKEGQHIYNDDRYDVDSEGSLTIKLPKPEMSGTYMCEAKNNAGSANVTIDVEIYTLPRMVQDEGSRSVTAAEGSELRLQCPVAAAGNFTIKWYKNAILQATGDLLLNVTREHSGTYACVAANAAGSASADVELAVEWSPKFERSPSSVVETVAGEDVALDCAVDAKPQAEIKWLFNSSPMVGEDSPRLRVLNVQLYHRGTYSCRASNAHGAVGRTFTLEVYEPPFISDFDVLDVSLKEGNDATLECNAKGSPAPNVTWIFNNTNWHQNTTSLHAHSLTSLHSGVFTCRAVNAVGAARVAYRVAVVSGARVTEIVAFGSDSESVGDGVEILVGTDARIACYASGNPEPLIKWIKDGNTITKQGGELPYADLIINNMTISQEGYYTCVASNEARMDDRSVKISALERPRISITPYEETTLDTQKHIQVLAGQTFHLTCHPYGNPVPLIYWFKNGVELRLFDETMISTDFREVLTSTDAVGELSGNYTCVARNRIGEAAFTYLLDVIEPPPQPKSEEQMTVVTGQTLSLSCPVSSGQRSWLRHPYTELSQALSSRIRISEDNGTLTIAPALLTDAGTYSCVTTNAAGAATQRYRVSVVAAASEREAGAGRGVALRCDGGHEVTWTRHGKPLDDKGPRTRLSEAGRVLSIARVRPSDAGAYECDATNAAGNATIKFWLTVRVAGEWSQWSRWGLCDATCGRGRQARSRDCRYEDDRLVIDRNNKTSEGIIFDDSACVGPAADRRWCHMPACEPSPQEPWSPWSAWGACSRACGAGTQARARSCRVAGSCRGDNVEIRKCPNLPPCYNALPTDDNSDDNYNDNDNDNDNDEDANDTREREPLEPYMPEERTPPQSDYSDVEEFYISTDASSPRSFVVEVTGGDGACSPGFEYNAEEDTCDDINECLQPTNACHATQQCVNTRGAYRCACPRGYRARAAGQRCLDVNECLLSARCSHACVNTAGGFACACPPRLRLRADGRTCAPPSYQHKRVTDDEYRTTSLDYPTRYVKNTRN